MALLEGREQIFQKCQIYLGGSWKYLSSEDVKISIIEGGLSNKLYLCEISNNSRITESDEPRKVVLRIYGKHIQEHPEMVTSIPVIFGLLAAEGISPKMYGVFSGGSIEEYIESRTLTTADLRLPGVSEECACIMARFHKMSMPLPKESNWLYDKLGRYTEEAEGIMKSLNRGSALITRPPGVRVRDKLNQIDFRTELETLKHILKDADSVVTFCHNDMQEGNLLLRSGASLDNVQGQLMAIDYEYASYNYRGFDIGNHFSEWCYQYTGVNEPPYFLDRLEDYPSRDEQLTFVRKYMAEMGFDNAEENPINSEEHILQEANTYALASHFKWALWAMKQATVCDIKFGYWEYAVARFDAYFKQRQNFH